MPDTRTLPDERRTRDDMLRRIDLLERRLREVGLHFEDEVEFSLGGAVFIARSGRHYPRESTRLREVLVSLDTPGETSTTVGIYKNNVLLEEIVHPADSDVPVVIPFGTLFDKDSDYQTVRVLVVGTGARDLNVQCRYG